MSLRRAPRSSWTCLQEKSTSKTKKRAEKLSIAMAMLAVSRLAGFWVVRTKIARWDISYRYPGHLTRHFQQRNLCVSLGAWGSHILWLGRRAKASFTRFRAMTRCWAKHIWAGTWEKGVTWFFQNLFFKFSYGITLPEPSKTNRIKKFHFFTEYWLFKKTVFLGELAHSFFNVNTTNT